MKINVEFSLKTLPSINDDRFGMVPCIHARSCSIGSGIDAEIDEWILLYTVYQIRDLNSINIEAGKP